VGGSAGACGGVAGGRVLETRAVARLVLALLGGGGLQLAVAAPVLASLPALDVPGGTGSVHAVGRRLDPDGGERALGGLDVGSLRPDLQRPVAELRLRRCREGKGERESGNRSESGARTSAAPDPRARH